MHYYLYEIRNNINGKIYIGVHKTKVLDDGYMGSGKVIKQAIEKHGVENFTKTILEIFETQEEMFAREKEIVTEEFLGREDTYNLRRGGLGGWDYLNKNWGRNSSHFIENDPRQKDIQEKLKSSGKHAFYNIEIQDRRIKMMVTNKIGYMDPEISKRGVLAMASPEANIKRKESFAKIGHQQGEKNSNFGTMWITNGTENMKIKNVDSIPEGWYRGRVF